MLNTTYRGSAINDDVTLTAPLHVGDLIAQINTAPGWPNGADHRLFVAQIDGGTDSEERVVCEQLSGSGPVTVTIVERGYDGTVESEHSVGATFTHDLDAAVVDQLVLHALDEGRDDHGQYLNTERHDIPARHQFGDALGNPAAPANIGTAAAVGVGNSPAREDHVHKLGTGAVDDPTMFAATVVDEAAIADGAVSTRALGDGVVTADKISAGLAAIAAALSTATGDDLPDGTATPVWFQPDKSRLYAYEAAAWRWRIGKPIKCALSYHADGNNIAADLPTWHDLNQFTADSDELSMASGGMTITIPANVAGPPAYQYDGEWDVIWRILVSNLGTTPGALELQLVTNTLTYLLGSLPSSPGHSTLLHGRLTVPLLALATARLQLTEGGANAVHVASGSTYELRFRGPA